MSCPHSMCETDWLLLQINTFYYYYYYLEERDRSFWKRFNCSNVVHMEWVWIRFVHTVFADKYYRKMRTWPLKWVHKNKTKNKRTSITLYQTHSSDMFYPHLSLLSLWVYLRMLVVGGLFIAAIRVVRTGRIFQYGVRIFCLGAKCWY